MPKFIEAIRRFLVLTTQASLVIFSFNVSIFLIYDGALPLTYMDKYFPIIITILAIKMFCFTVIRTHSGWWRYVSIYDLVLLVKANVFASLMVALFYNFGPNQNYNISNYLIVLDGLLCFLFMSGARVTLRLVHEFSTAAHKYYGNRTENILIVGAGAAGQSIVREIQQNPHMNWKVTGFVDQDVTRVKQRFQGVMVLSTISGLQSLLRSIPIDLVVLADPSLCHKELRNIVETCRAFGVKSKILPNVESILNDGVSIHHMRDVKFEDLLGRPPVSLDVSNISKYLGNKKVMVTGAAGSIGSEICRQVAKFGANSVLLLDNSETPLFNIERELKTRFPGIHFIARLNDVRDGCQVNEVFKTFRPEVVFHAAAYKHVPMSEQNPITVIGNNVIGTRVLVNAADRYKVQHFVMVSTDKAVNPTNIMGASKRAAEVYVQAMARTSQTMMVTVRFGNVLGSNGSVVPIFQEQIHKGGPVTVTHPDVTRFFMTIPEAVQLVLQAGSMGKGGEIFVLDMGEQIKIMHLAEELIRLSGLIPYKDIDIEFTGLRPGEKLHEELLHDKEGVLRTSHEKIHVARARAHNCIEIKQLLDDLVIACQTLNMNQTMSILTTMVPECKLEGGWHADKFHEHKFRGSKIFKFPREFAGKTSR